jgi:Protein of unknown function (DUF1003)
MAENRTETAKRFLAKEINKLSEQERQVVYAAPIIMMSQNRQSEKDHLQAKNDYERTGIGIITRTRMRRAWDAGGGRPTWAGM